MKKYAPVLIMGVMLHAICMGQHQQRSMLLEDPAQNALIRVATKDIHPSSFILLPPHGETSFFSGDRMLYKTFVAGNELHGEWQSWYTNGKLLDSGRLRHGLPDGEWKYRDSAGHLLAVRNYDAGKLQLVRQEMRHFHPKRSFFPLAVLYQSNEQYALRFLTVNYSFSSAITLDKLISLEELVNRNGLQPAFYHPPFNQLLHHGQYINFFPGGIVRDSGYYKDGLRHDLWIHRNYPHGSWWTGAYRNGVRQMEWKEYDANGRLTNLIFYNRKGEETGRRAIARPGNSN